MCWRKKLFVYDISDPIDHNISTDSLTNFCIGCVNPSEYREMWKPFRSTEKDRDHSVQSIVEKQKKTESTRKHINIPFIGHLRGNFL